MSAIIEMPSANLPLIGNLNGQSLKLRQITVKEYDSMIENDVFDENDQIELLNGAIIEKMPKGTKHSSTNDRITRTLYRNFGNETIIRNQNPIWLDDFSEPEPDIVLAIPKEDEYQNSNPTPNEILLILEVSDTTLGYDRNVKGVAYSRAGIQQYLILNLQDKTIEDYREPSFDGYQSKQTYRIGQTFSLVAFSGILLAVKDFLPTENN